MNKIKPLTLEETKLKEEMKARCLNGGQYKDVNAKKKFNVLCHLEDFEIQYWKLEQENQASKQTINELSNQVTKLIEEKHNLKVWLKQYIKLLENKPDIIEEGQIDTLHEVLDKIKELESVV